MSVESVLAGISGLTDGERAAILAESAAAADVQCEILRTLKEIAGHLKVGSDTTTEDALELSKL